MTESKAIATTDAQPRTFLDIVASAIENPNFDADRLGKLLDMQERIMAKQAEIEFNEAMARIAQEMPRIIKHSSVGYKEDKKDPNSKTVEAFKFASYEDIDKIVRPLLVKEGFSLSFSSEERAGAGGGIVMTGTLSHVKGHSRSASVPLALDASGGKNNIQGMGSSTSYGRRYTMCMLLNIVTVGEDDDGVGMDSFISLEQAVDIDLLIKETGTKLPTILKLAKANEVREIKVKDFNRVVNSLKAIKLDALEKKKEAQ